MFKFFRQLRYKLIKVNNMGKYFKYAIGEILLVVIGILIAVQINGYYQKRSQENENRQILQRMLVEINNNIERAEFLDEHSNSAIVRAYTIPPLKPSEEKLDSCYNIVSKGIRITDIPFLVKSSDYNFNALRMYSSVYNEMINTGKLYVIQSKSLIDEIEVYYNFINRQEYYRSGQIQDIKKSYEECKYGWFNFKQNYDMSPQEAISANPWLFDRNSKEYINYHNYIYQARRITIRTRERCFNIIQSSKNLKQSINSYLND